MWSPFSEGGFNIFPEQTQQYEFTSAQSQDSWKIDLPGGGFIEAPGSELRSNTPDNHFTTGAQFTDEFATPEERNSLLNKLDVLLEERASRDRALQDLLAKENSLRHRLNEVHEALDFQSGELSVLTDAVHSRKVEMLDRIETKKSAIATLQDTLRYLHREETRTACYKIVAAESRGLRKQIAQGCETKKALQQNVNELDKTVDLLMLRCRTIEQEEKAVLNMCEVELEKYAEDGCLYDVGTGKFFANNTDEIIVAAEIHEEPKTSRPALQSVVRMIKHCKNNLGEQLARNGEYQQLAEEIEVLEDNGALKEKAKKGGFMSFAKKLFRRKRKSGFKQAKQSKNELLMNDTVTMSEASTRSRRPLNRETSIQE